MACKTFKLGVLLSLVTLPLVLPLQTQMVFAQEDYDNVVEYILDAPSVPVRPGRRFLATVIKKGAHCNAFTHNICNGVRANNGTSLLRCCKKHCRNILGDENNCGKCGHKCRFGELCCHGRCINSYNNVHNCGKCDRKCLPGISCEFGVCGYA